MMPSEHRANTPLAKSRCLGMRSAWLRPRYAWGFWFAWLIALSGGVTKAQTPSIRIGIDGVCRIGHTTIIQTDDASPDPLQARTRDGDGAAVIFRDHLSTASDANRRSTSVLVKPTASAAPLVVGHSLQSPIFKGRFPEIDLIGRRPTMIDLSTPWMVAIGNTLGVDEIGLNVVRRDPAVAVSKVASASELPTTRLGYDGVTLVSIQADGVTTLSNMSEIQQHAIVDWIHDGGRFFVSLGSDAERIVDAAPWILNLLNFDRPSVVDLAPAAVENYVASQQPLENFRGVRLPRDRGETLIAGRTANRLSAVIAARYRVGFGEVTVLAADLHDGPLARWPDRMDLLHRLTEDRLRPVEEADLGSRQTAYDDLSGQLRSTLDRFNIRRGFPFSLIAIILLALAAIIGPVDYFLVNRWFRRSWTGWLTFLLAIAVVTSALYVPSRAVGEGSDALQHRRVEVMDIDLTDNFAGGTSVDYLYTHDARRISARIRPSSMMASTSDTQKPVDNTSSNPTSLITVPWTFSDRAFGGIPLAIDDDRLPAYVCQSTSLWTEMNTAPMSTVGRLPLPPRGSKGLISKWSMPAKSLPINEPIRPRRRSGKELLTGSISNPLPIDLLDGRLVYGNWSYQLPTRFAAGEVIDDVTQLRQKNFRWQLTRQVAMENARQTSPYDPTPAMTADRIVEVAMFHDAAGGSDYTSLRNVPLARLDRSGSLTEDRCMLVGRVEAPLLQWDIRAAGEDEAADDIVDGGDPVSVREQRRSMIRVVLPVDPPRSERSRF